MWQWVKDPSIVVCGHTTLNASDLVRSRKLSRVGRGPYLDGRTPALSLRQLGSLLRQVRSLAQGLLYALGVAKKKK